MTRIGLYNPKAGSFNLDTIRAQYPDLKLQPTTTPLPKDSITEIWVIGGDGTLRWLLQTLLKQDVPIRLIPASTANVLSQAVCADTKLDVGQCNDQLFALAISFGLDSLATHKVSPFF